jgi:hypothetical protein
MTQEDKDKLLTYFTMCQALIHIIEDDWKGNPANKQKIKQITKQQINELEKVIEILLPRGDYSEKGMQVTEQFIEAAESMVRFYKIGVAMSRLSDEKRELVNIGLTSLLKYHEIL